MFWEFKKSKMLWIGLTGGLASGKSTVTQILRKQGVTVIDADEIAHQALLPNQKTYQQIVSHFGSKILNGDQTIDRKKLGALVFAQINECQFLESIVHPYVQAEVFKLKIEAEKRNEKIAIYDVPLLFEKNLQDNFDRTLLVSCSYQKQKQRLMQRNQFSESDAELRLAAQLPLQQKTQLADDEIQNEGTLVELEQKVLDWLKRVTKAD